MLDYSKMTAFQEKASLEYAIQPIPEATYYGKNKYLLQVEKILDEMIIMAHANKDGVTTQAFSDKMFDVAEILRKVFGFYSLEINSSIFLVIPSIMKDFSSTAGSTLCHSVIFKYTRMVSGNLKTERIDLDKTHQGVKFTKGSLYSMRMFLSTSYFLAEGPARYTGAEILAVMLHEIGHSFYVGPVNEMLSEVLIMMSLPDMMQYVYTEIGLIMISDVLPIAEKRYLPKEVSSAINRVFNVISPVISFITDSVTFAKKLKMVCELIAQIAYIPLNANKIMRAVLDYDAEKYSDAFATAYGYGLEFSTGLQKDQYIRMTPLTANAPAQFSYTIINLLCSYCTALASVLMDPHPDNEARLLNNIKYMEAAAKNIKDPHVAKEYNAQLENMKSLKKELVEYRGTDPVKLNSKAALFLHDFCGVVDVKDFFSDLNAKYSKYKNLDM